MPKKKKTAPAAAKDASDKIQSKQLQHDELKPTNELLYTTYSEGDVDELLEIVGDKSPQSRHDLLNALQLAQFVYDDERERGSRERPSSRLIEQLEDNIEKTSMLLSRIRRYRDFRNIGFITQQVGRGVITLSLVEGLPRNPSISDHELTFPSFDGNGKIAGINIVPLLRATLLDARRRKRGRGGPKSLGKQAVVFYAEQFFSQRAATKPSTDPKNPFHEFAERFYKVVAKSKPDSLDRQLRSVFAARRSGH